MVAVGAVVVWFLVATACRSSDDDRQLPAPVPSQLIAFLSDRGRSDFNLDLHSVHPPTARITRLTSGQDISGFDWSPGGERIVFSAGIRGDIFLIRAGGRQIKNLTKTRDDSEYEPRWAPNGSKILFLRETISNRQGNVTNVTRAIHIMNADGSGVMALNLGEVKGATVHPGLVWSPDSSGFALVNRVILRSGETVISHTDIYFAGADGTGLRNLTSSPSNDDSPAWSPDGTKLAFTSEREGDSEVFVMNSDGSGVTILTQNDARDDSPVWSPDGSRIAFMNRTSDEDPFGSIFVMRADGSEAVRVAARAACCLVSWSPDGARIVFSGEAKGNLEVYSGKSDGSGGLENLSKHRSTDRNPVWQPKAASGQALAY